MDKRARLGLKHLHQKITKGYESLSDYELSGCFTLGSSGTITHANERFYELTGFEKKEIVGKKTILELVRTEDRPWFERDYATFLKKKGFVERVPLQLIRKDNSPLKAFLSSIHCEDSGCSEIFIQSAIKPADISEHKIRLDAVIITNAALSEEVNRLKDRLAAQADYIAKQIRYQEDLHKTKDKFFNIVAHDLKSPLNALRSFLALLIKHSESVTIQQIQEMGVHLDSRLDNTIRLTDNLITWAKIQMKADVFQPTETPVSELMENTIEIYKGIAARKGINLVCHIQSNLMIFADNYQMSFCIRNVIDNAIKFTPAGGTVSVICKSTTETTIEIIVSDTGKGIPKNLQDNLFTVGQIRNSVGTAGERGTGMGLVLSHEFIVINNGTIKFESNPASGTTFTIALNKLPEALPSAVQ